MPVTPPADKRFLRAAHARPARRRRPWRGAVVLAVKVAVLAAALGYGGYRAVAFVQASDALQVRKITVRGNERMSSAEVVALLGGVRGQNLLRVDLVAARGRLAGSPWVAGAVLRRRLPSTIDVVIAERHPMGIARLHGDLFLVDDRGAVMEAYGPKYADLDLPLIDGLQPAPGASRVDAARVALAARLIEELRTDPGLFGRVSQIDVADASDATVILDEDAPAVVRLGDRQFLERLRAYLEIATALRQHVPAIDYVDLRFGARVFVGTAGKRAAGARAGVKAGF